MKSNDTIYTLTTEFSENMDKSCPWNVYPRPQLKRDSFLCLNGLWDFTISDGHEIPKNFNQKILVPFPPESELSGINKGIDKHETLYYRRTFSVPDGFIKDRLLLRFGAVDRFARLYVNNVEMGVHSCGYTPFFADITDVIQDGENEILLEVKDGTSHLYPYGKQKKKRGGMWYTEVSGIWQTVWLESVPDGYIENVKITPSLTSAKIEVFTKKKCKSLTLIDTGEVFCFDGNEITVSPKNPQNWTPESPYLYRAVIETENDSVETYFALRTVTAERVGKNTRLCLNGKPYLFNGLLDQGYFPDGIFLPATEKGYEKDILFAKSLGFNTLRKHIKLEPPIFYYLCDKLGIAVFQDMVNNGKYSFIRDTALPTLFMKRKNDTRSHKSITGREAFLRCAKETVNALYNYPSVVYYTLFNEGWGQFEADGAYALIKSMDSTRIIDATSGWFWRSDSDVFSHHIYFKRPRPKQNGIRPLVLSEFGGFSYRVEGHLYGEKNYGYSTCKTAEEFENKVLKLYSDDVMPLVKNGISALIYTQLSDIEDETNGFITYDRRVSKISAEKMRSIAELMYQKSSGGESDGE